MKNRTTIMFYKNLKTLISVVAMTIVFLPIFVAADPGLTLYVPSNQSTYLDQANPALAFGGQNTLQIASQAPSLNQRGLVMFDIPNGITVTSATLQMHVTANTLGDQYRVYELHKIISAWSESGVTWSTEPTISPDTSAITPVTGTDTVLSWDVTSDVQALYQNGIVTDNNGWEIVDNNPDASTTALSVTLATRFASTDLQPQLILAFIPPGATSSPATTTPAQVTVRNYTSSISGDMFLLTPIATTSTETFNPTTLTNGQSYTFTPVLGGEYTLTQVIIGGTGPDTASCGITVFQIGTGSTTTTVDPRSNNLLVPSGSDVDCIFGQAPATTTSNTAGTSDTSTTTATTTLVENRSNVNTGAGGGNVSGGGNGPINGSFGAQSQSARTFVAVNSTIESASFKEGVVDRSTSPSRPEAYSGNGPTLSSKTSTATYKYIGQATTTSNSEPVPQPVNPINNEQGFTNQLASVSALGQWFSWYWWVLLGILLLCSISYIFLQKKK